MAELPLDLKKLDSLPSALDIIRYLHKHPAGAADIDDICEALDITERRFRKANRRLVTTGYLQMRSDFVYELTQKGQLAAEELAEYDASAPADDGTKEGKVQRQLLVAMPRVLIANQAAPLYIGFPPDETGKFPNSTEIALRLNTMYADLSSDSDEIISLNGSTQRHELEITPQNYDQIRLRVQVYQFSPAGDDLTNCGGLYVDVAVHTEGETGEMIAYAADLEFNTH